MADQEAKPKAAITNIYYDCLERIFDFLPLKDLLHVAQTCKRLQIAAAAKFSDEYGGKRIMLEFPEIDGEPGIMRNHIVVYFDDIFIAGLKFQLAFLRCFGAKISHLDFGTKCANKHKTIFKQYIHQYCADTLTSFAFPRNTGFTAQKPFKSLEKLTIDGGYFENVIPESVNWYPNLRHLELVRVVVGVYSRIQPLETLEKLVIKYGDLYNTFPKFVHWFPNLRYLELHFVDIDTDFIAVSIPHLEHLGISMCQSTMRYIANLLNANLQLRSLDITMTDHPTTTTNLTTILNMIRAHRSMTKIKVALNTITEVSADELAQLTNEHPLMTELDLQEYKFTADNALGLIGHLNLLEKFMFCVRDESQCNRVREQLNDDWQFNYQRLEHQLNDLACSIQLNRNR